MTQVTIGRPLPPSQRSRASDLAAQWGPLLLTITAMLAGALKLNEEALANIKQLQEVTTRLEAESEANRDAQALLGTKFDAFVANMQDYRTFNDAALCRLDVKAPSGCPDVAYEPEPMSKSKAKRIQPKVKVKPLDLDQ